MTPFDDRVLMATGFAKWGMTGGTAAAQLLTDLVLGRENPYAALFDPNRLNLRASAPSSCARTRGRRALRRRPRQAPRTPADRRPAPGEGDIVRHGGEKVAAYRDEDGTLDAVSPSAPTSAARSTSTAPSARWDCPCHGSRFAVDGTVLQGPAVHRLEVKAHLRGLTL